MRERERERERDVKQYLKNEDYTPFNCLCSTATEQYGYNHYTTLTHLTLAIERTKQKTI